MGVEPHAPSAERAKARLRPVQNAVIYNVSFEEYEAAPATFDAIIFVASLHHMEQEKAIKKAKSLLADGGDIGVPVQKPGLSLSRIRELVRDNLPNAEMRQGLYYRYLLTWVK